LSEDVVIIGAGLAGSEAAWQLAERGVAVRLYEMRPLTQTPIHRTGDAAELVCSNSLKSLEHKTASGCLKYELAALGSLLLELALAEQVPAGKALAVDRLRFAQRVTKRLSEHPRIQLVRQELSGLQALAARDLPTIIATGPLTAPALEGELSRFLGIKHLAFFDAAAPIVESETLDRNRLFAQTRYGLGSADYLNAPLNKEEYERFVAALIAAERVINRDFETEDLFQACQPVEEVARKGLDTLRFGALKPVGLIDPASGHRPWAVVQLRAESRAHTAYNLVGFQTNLKFSEQERVLRMIPGLEEAEFSRFGVMHRNTYIDAPRLLDRDLSLRTHPNLFFAGQVCGTEGYCEAIASGALAALGAYARLRGRPAPKLPPESSFGALIDYACSAETADYQPMHVNFGIMQALDKPIRKKDERYRAYSARAQSAIDGFLRERADLGFLPRLPTGFLLE